MKASALFLALAVSAGANSIVGDWTAQSQDLAVRVVLGADGTFTRTIADSTGTATARGRYRLQGASLIVEPLGESPMRFAIRALATNRLVLVAGDGSVLSLVRTATGATARRDAPPNRAPAPPPVTAPPPARTTPGTTAAPVAPPNRAPAPARVAAGSFVPEWVRPGLRLTYYLLTGSVSGSVNGYVLDEEEGKYRDREGHRYSTDRLGHSSHGLVQPTVVGMDAQTVALAQPFYLFVANDTTPILTSHMASLVTADTGGDFWMHPQKQAMTSRPSPCRPTAHGSPPPTYTTGRRGCSFARSRGTAAAPPVQ